MRVPSGEIFTSRIQRASAEAPVGRTDAARISMVNFFISWQKYFFRYWPGYGNAATPEACDAYFRRYM